MAENHIVRQASDDLSALLDCAPIEPGTAAGYDTCKLLWEKHPLGGKLVEKPVTMALFKPRIIHVDDDPDDRISKRFTDVWDALRVTEKIRNLYFCARCYGAAAIGVGTRSVPVSEPLPQSGLDEHDIFINVFDPLNVSGSLVTGQDPNSPDFQQSDAFLSVQGQRWHPSRTMKVFNGAPVYLSFQQSSFGFTGRSVFQRALFPLKSFLSTMETDDLVSEKAGMIVVRENQKNSVISGVMAQVSRLRRSLVKQGRTGGVLSIGQQDGIESLNLQNIDGAMKTARENIISAIAMSCDIPARLIQDEAFALGFSDGTEDARAVAQYIEGVRNGMNDVFAFFERLVQSIAWSEAFFVALKAEFPDVVEGGFQENFYRWRSSFSSTWEELTQESPQERQEAESKVVRNIARLFSMLVPTLDPENRATLCTWVADVVNSLETTRRSPLILDEEKIADYEPPSMMPGGGYGMGDDDDE